MMSASGESTLVLCTVACEAPAQSSVDEFVRLARTSGGPFGQSAHGDERFVYTGELAPLTGDRVRIGFRMPGDPRRVAERPGWGRACRQQRLRRTVGHFRSLMRPGIGPLEPVTTDNPV